jgi:hypothetical protein
MNGLLIDTLERNVLTQQLFMTALNGGGSYVETSFFVSGVSCKNGRENRKETNKGSCKGGANGAGGLQG